MNISNRRAHMSWPNTRLAVKVAAAVLLCGAAIHAVDRGLAASQAQASAAAQFGGAYATLDARRQKLVDDWVARFAQATGQKLPPRTLYDDVVSFSGKTTFEAITHALMTTSLTDGSAAPLGDALSVVERVEAVKGEIPGVPGDRQFRMYARLTPNALDILERSREFSRRADNSVYHKGYPINYRQRRGVPSIQFSVAVDERRADIDVDYRSANFPVGLFNGHLTSSNSDVRAGNNYDRHINRWVGFQNWWRSFFGVRLNQAPDDVATAIPLALPKAPRAGKKDIDVMVNDFLNAWFVDGDIIAAMAYVSERSYACLAQDTDDPSDFDRGVAPYQLMSRLRAAHDALGNHTSLAGLTVGVHYTKPGLKVVTQPHHAQFVIYAVRDDIAAQFDCESRLTLSDGKSVTRAYGKYFGATFNVTGRQDHTVALLWRNEGGYWKIVSWHAGTDAADTPTPNAPPPGKVVRASGDASLVNAARDFLDRWLIRKDYEQAFRYFSTKSYACYDLIRRPGEPASSPADAGQRIRVALARAGDRVGGGYTLKQILSPMEPFHPAVRLIDHPYSDTFTLTQFPNALTEAADCAALTGGARFPKHLPLEYGNGFGMNFRFRMLGGEPPVLRMLWVRENDAWRITAFDVETP